MNMVDCVSHAPVLHIVMDLPNWHKKYCYWEATSLSTAATATIATATTNAGASAGTVATTAAAAATTATTIRN